jgi:DNA-directed RNA polymerase specialized sigma24 family protein
MEPESIAEHIVNTFESAEESFEKGEEQKAVLKLIETAHKLLYEKNPKWSYILIDSRIAGMSSAQIAKVMNTSTSNVDAIKSRARAYLRKKLGKQYYELVCNKLF